MDKHWTPSPPPIDAQHPPPPSNGSGSAAGAQCRAVGGWALTDDAIAVAVPVVGWSMVKRWHTPPRRAFSYCCCFICFILCCEGSTPGGRGGIRRRPPPPCHCLRRGGTDPARAGEAGRCGTSSIGYGPTAAAVGMADRRSRKPKHQRHRWF